MFRTADFLGVLILASMLAESSFAANQTWHCSYKGSISFAHSTKRKNFDWSATFSGSGANWTFSGDTPDARISGNCNDTTCLLTETLSHGGKRGNQQYWTVKYREDATTSSNRIKSTLNGSFGPTTSDRMRGGTITSSGLCTLAGSTSPDDEQALTSFLVTLKGIVEKHDWRAFINLCEREHYDEQSGLGMGNPQYIAESLGLHFESNNIAKGNETITRDHMDQIRKIDFDTIPAKRDKDILTIKGTVTLFDGRTLKVKMLVLEQRDSKGQYRFILTGNFG